MLNYHWTQPLDIGHSPTYGFPMLPKNWYNDFFLPDS